MDIGHCPIGQCPLHGLLGNISRKNQGEVKNRTRIRSLYGEKRSTETEVDLIKKK